MLCGAIATAFGGLTACGIELFLSGTLLVVIRKHRGELPQLFTHSGRYYLVCGSCWIANVSLFWAAVSSVTDQQQLVIVGLINYLWPSLTLLGAVVILKRPWRWSLLPGLAIAFMGIVIARLEMMPGAFAQLAQQLSDEPNLPAYLFAATDAVAWALYSNYSRKYARVGATGAIPLFMLTASLPLLAFGQLRGEVMQASVADLFLLLIWAVLGASAYICWDWGMRVGRIVTISSFSMCIPLFSTVITAWMGGVPLSLGLLLGAVAVVVGAGVCRMAVDD